PRAAVDVAEPESDRDRDHQRHADCRARELELLAGLVEQEAQVVSDEGDRVAEGLHRAISLLAHGVSTRWAPAISAYTTTASSVVKTAAATNSVLKSVVMALKIGPPSPSSTMTAPIAGALVTRLGERPLVVAGLLMQAAGLGWIAMVASSGVVAYPALVVPLVLAGVGVSMAMPAAQNAILSSVGVTEMGKASGVFNMGRFLGGMF